MQTYSIDVKDFIGKSQFMPVIDVRSPAEYEHGHIPGALNLPLFSNVERSVIGTLYSQKGSDEAILKGLDMTGPKMRYFVEKGHALAPGGEMLLHCWRGGMRSNSMAWLLNTAGIKTHTLNGGYKSYRRFTREIFELPLWLIVIGGMTGAGKSEILEQLELLGEQVIHLERLASHKGSVFGGIGMPSQPTTEQFENDLCRCLLHLDYKRPVFVEDESQAIGNIYLPRSFYDQMSTAHFIHVKLPFQDRIERLIRTYHTNDPQLLIDGVMKIEKRLGFENAGHILCYIREGNIRQAAEILLNYYDKVYAHSMGLHQRKSVTEIDEQTTPDFMARKIAVMVQQPAFNNLK